MSVQLVVPLCEECGSSYFADSSVMMQLCSECAHHLYGYPLCGHDFVHQRCVKCGWDGSRSTYLQELLKTASTE